MRVEGVEPSRANAHGILSPARLPIPPHPLEFVLYFILEEVEMIPMEKNESVQDEFIEELKRKNATVTVFLTRGNRITGKILNHDKYTVLLEVEGEPNLIYKHAISTIVLGG